MALTGSWETRKIGQSEKVGGGYLKKFLGCLKKNRGRIEGDILETGRVLRLREYFLLEPGKDSERESYRGV